MKPAGREPRFVDRVGNELNKENRERNQKQGKDGFESRSIHVQ